MDEDTPIDEDERDVVCTITDAQLDRRPDDVRATLIESYLGEAERPDGYTYSFEGTTEPLVAVATFVANERHCCSFATYTITVAPPYDETQLTVTGPDGTKALFDETLIDHLRRL